MTASAAKTLPAAQMLLIAVLVLASFFPQLAAAQTQEPGSTPPASAPDLTLQPAGATSITATWTAVEDATGYRLWRWHADEDWVQIGGGTLSETTHTDTGLAPGTYYYAVAAVNAAGIGPFSQNIPVTLAESPPASAPDLTLQPAGATSITATWTAVEDATGYRLWRWHADEDWVQTGGGTLSETTHTDTGLAPGTYYYAVAAVNTAGIGPFSPNTPVTLAESPPASAPDLTLQPAGAASITATWTAVEDATGYELWRWHADEDWVQIGGGALSETTHTDTGLAPGTYYYTVAAVNAAGRGPTSGDMPFTLSPPAAGAQSTIPGQASVTAGATHSARVTAGEFDLASGNTEPRGIWSNRTTTWVANDSTDDSDNRLYAYNLNDGARVAARDIVLAGGNDHIEDIWSNGATIWVADDSDDKLYAYNLNDGARVTASEFNLASGNDQPKGIWSDGATIWVADRSDEKLYAYNLSDGARVTASEFDLASGNDRPEGIWSDRTTIWVADRSDEKLYAYNLENGARVAAKDIDSNTLRTAGNYHPTGIWSNGAAIWVADDSDDKLYAYGLETDVTPPADKPSLSARVPTESSVQLTWTAVTGATAYPLERSADGSSWNALAAAAATVYTDTDGISAGQEYYYRVRARNAGGGGPWSDAVRVRVLTAPVLTLAGKGPTECRLSWDTVTNAIGYNLWRHHDDSDTDQQVGVALTGTSYTDSGLTANHRYYYTLQAITAHGVAGPDSNRLFCNPRWDDEELGARAEHRDISLAAANDGTTGIWANDETVWVVSRTADRLFAYTLEDGARAQHKEFDLTAANNDPDGIWSDGETIWVADDGADRLFAYALENGARAQHKEFDLAAANIRPRGIWSDGETVWVVDRYADRLFAYTLENGARAQHKEFDLAAANDDPEGIWSDGATIWVVNWGEHKLFAYTLEDGAHTQHKEFDLAAANDAPDGVWSDGATIWVGNYTGENKLYAYTLATGPTAPADKPALSARVPTESSVKLTWTAVDRATDYQLEWSLNGSLWNALAAPTATAYTDTDGISAGQEYYYRVRGRNAGGDGPWSDAVRVLVLTAPVLTLAGKGPTECRLSWDTVTSAAGYNLWRHHAATDTDHQVGGALTGTSYTDSGLTANHRYYYTLQAITAHGVAGPDSDRLLCDLDVNPPAEKPALTAHSAGPTSAALTWSAVADATGYVLWRWHVVEKWKQVGGGTLTGTTYTDTTLTTGQTYHYAVAAVNDAGRGPFSEYTPVTPAPAADRAALMALYNAAGGAGWNNHDNWDSNLPIGEWRGVTTDNNGRVTGLDLLGNGLSGTIPAALGNLSSLTSLDLGHNRLTGPIPPQLGNLTNLQYLHLNNNRLSGTIPAELGSLTNLAGLQLAGNPLTGCIPTALQGVRNNDLDQLNLQPCPKPNPPAEKPALTAQSATPASAALTWSAVTGATGYVLWRWHVVEKWKQVGGGTLTGTTYTDTTLTTGQTYHYAVAAVNDAGRGPFSEYTPVTPAPAADRAALMALYNAAGGAGWNNHDNWDSNLPIGEWRGVTTDGNGRVTSLVLSNNGLNGTIPPELGNLAHLERLDLWGNRLSGEIPSSLGNLTNLAYLDLSGNRLSGAFPAWIGSLTGLEYLFLQNNQLSGAIPPELGALRNLTHLYLDGDRLSFPTQRQAGFLAQQRDEISSEVIFVVPLVLLAGKILFAIKIAALIAKIGKLAVLVGKLALWSMTFAGKVWTWSKAHLLHHLIVHAIAHSLVEISHWMEEALDNTRLDRVSGLSDQFPSLAYTNMPGIKEYYAFCWSSTLDRAVDSEFQGETLQTVQNAVNLYRLQLCPWQAASTVETDRMALIVLYMETEGTGWNHDTNWLSEEPFNQWYGVSTDANGRVRALDLRDNGLLGQFPLEAGQLLDRLDTLYLRGNSLSGCIPAILRNVQNSDLNSLGLPFCDRTATDRAALMALYNAAGPAGWNDDTNWNTSQPISEWYGVTTDGNGRVTSLVLSNNGLNGTIPPQLGSLAHLERLDLWGNRLSGSIPSELGSLTALEHLYLAGNRLSGCIPAALQDVRNNDLDQLNLQPCPNQNPPADKPSLSARVPTESSVQLTWTAVDRATDYQLQWSLNGSSWNLLAAPAATAYTDTDGISPGRAFHYRVRARNAAGDGPWSDAVRVRVLTAPVLTLAGKGPTECRLSWDTVTNAIGYNLWRHHDDSDTDQQVGVALTGTSYTDSGLTANHRYYYTLQAITAHGVAGPDSNRLFCRP